MKIKADDVSFFKNLPRKEAARVSRLFKVRRLSKGDYLVKKEEPYNDVFIIASPGLRAHDDDNESFNEKLTLYSTLGERSLLGIEKAAFSVIADEDAAVICTPVNKLKSHASANPAFALAQFTRLASDLNQKMTTMAETVKAETDKLRNSVYGMISESKIDSRLAETHMAVNKAGAQMFDKLAEVLPKLDSFKEAVNEELLTEVKATINDVLVADSQNFDFISQEIELVHKYVINIQEFLLYQKVKPIESDFDLGEVMSRDKEKSEVLFF